MRGVFYTSACTQASLLASLYDVHGLDPVVHPPAFYGNPEDVPPRPPVIAAQRAQLPSADIDSLPPFFPHGGVLHDRAHLPPRAPAPPLHVTTPLGPLQVPGPVPLRVLSYAPPPPDPTALWHRPPAPAFGSGFVTDRARGCLVPVGASQADGAEDEVGLSLVATPLDPQGGGGSTTGPPTAPTAPTQPLTGVDHASTVPGSEFRPPSPKYDERSFFISPLQLVMPTQPAESAVTAPATESTVGGVKQGPPAPRQHRRRPASQITPPSRSIGAFLDFLG